MSLLMKQADIVSENNILFIRGKIDFFNVMSVYQESLAFLKDHSPCTIDFSRLLEVNSAGIALIIEWIKYSKAEDKPIVFQGIPQDLIALAKAANIDSLF